MRPIINKSYEIKRCPENELCNCETELEGTDQPPCGVEVLVIAVVFEPGGAKTRAHVAFGHPEDRLTAWVDAEILRNLV